MTADWGRARAVADAVLYEGYLLYPYRASSSRNRSRWQWGVLGPAGAAEAGIGEDDTIAAQFLVDGAQAINLVVRFLQLQHRRAERETGWRRFEPVSELITPSGSWLTWDEAVEHEESFGPFAFHESAQPWTLSLTAAGGNRNRTGRRRSACPGTAGGERHVDRRRRAGRCAGSGLGTHRKHRCSCY